MPNSEKRHHLTVLPRRSDDPPRGPSVRCADGQITGVLRLPACAMLQQAIDGVRDSVAILDHDYRFVAVNETYRETFRRTHGRVVSSGMSFLDVLSHAPEQRERAAGLWGRALGGETVSVTEHFGDDRQGKKRFLEITYSPILAEDGSVVAAMDCCRDVTDRLVSEAALEASLHQAAKMGAIGQLAGGIAHDFNNLLTVILSGVQTLQCGVQDAAADRDLISDISAAAERARDLASRLLAFARRQPISPRAIDVNAIVRDGEKLLRRVISPRVAIHTRLEEPLGRVHCDPGQLEQVILNLAVNARDAMPAGGELFIETANADLDAIEASRHPCARAGAFVRITIRDTGVGMSADVREHLFEPFFTTKPVGGGTGLGLAIVYGIVKQNAGHVHVESAPGEGTRFDLFLPRIS